MDDEMIEAWALAGAKATYQSIPNRVRVADAKRLRKELEDAIAAVLRRHAIP